MHSTTLQSSGRKLSRFGARLSPLWLTLPGVLFLAAFLLFPSLRLLSLSVVDRTTGAFSLSVFGRFFGPSVYRQVLGTTFVIALETTFFCLVFGYPLAYWLAGLSKRRQTITVLLVLLAYWTSTLVKNFAWLVLLGRNGIVAKIMALVGMHGGDQLLFNRPVVVFAMTHTMLPLAVVTMLPVMNQIDKRLSMAAATLGADAAQMFWRVFFALSMRGVAAAGLLVFIGSLGFFITPTLLGSPRETMLGQFIITQINELQDWQLGSVLAVVLVASALLSCFIYDLLFGLSALADDSKSSKSAYKRYLRRFGMELIGIVAWVFSWVGKFHQRFSGKIIRFRLLSAYSWIAIGVLLFPIVAIVPMAFTSSSFLSFPPQGFSTKWFQAYLDSPLWIDATLRSFGIGAVVSLLTLAIAIIAALGIARSHSRLSSLLFLLFLLPMTVPSIVISVALFYLFAHISLVATNTGIVIGHTVIAMPIVFIILLTTFKGHDWVLDSAASTLGANRLQTLRRITLPLIKDGVAAALVTGFLVSFEELTVALFIGGGIKTTLPKQLWDDILLQVNPTLAAASVVVLSIVTLAFLLLQYIQPNKDKTLPR